MDHSWSGLSESPRHCCVSPAVFFFSSCVDVFFEEFSAYLESIVLPSEPLLITGDFNIHVDVVGDSVRMPTHELGHTLDLIITRQCDALVKDPPVSDYHISDHWSVTCVLSTSQ